MSIQRLQFNKKEKNQIPSGLESRQHYLGLCSSRKLTYSKEGFATYAHRHVKLIEFLSPCHTAMGAAKSKDLEIEDSLPSVF